MSKQGRTILIQHNDYIGEFVAHILQQKILQVLRERSTLAARYQVAHLVDIRRLAWRLPQPNNFDHERALQLLKFREHDHNVKILILGQELHAELFESRQIERVHVAKHT